MNDQQSKNADYLFDAIGTLDDRFLAEAESPLSARSVIRTKRRRVAALIAAVLALTVMGSTFRFLFRLQTSPPAQDTAPNGQVPPLQNNSSNEQRPSESKQTLDDILLEAAENAPALSKDEIDLLDGSMKIVWKENGSQTYHVLRVEGSENQKDLAATLKNRSSQKVKSEPTFALWICYPDGTVICPYLANTPGNVGYQTLFSYSAEVMPTNRFINLINNLLY